MREGLRRCCNHRVGPPSPPNLNKWIAKARPLLGFGASEHASEGKLRPCLPSPARPAPGLAFPTAPAQTPATNWGIAMKITTVETYWTQTPFDMGGKPKVM